MLWSSYKWQHLLHLPGSRLLYQARNNLFVGFNLWFNNFSVFSLVDYDVASAKIAAILCYLVYTFVFDKSLFDFCVLYC